jgi:serine/threonine protein kinase
MRQPESGEFRVNDIADFVTGGALRWYNSASPNARTDGGEAPHELPPGSRLGPYRIESLIGRGGSSLVYRAQRCDDAFSQTVAIKVVRDGIGAEAARLERDHLARLTHPFIARIFDAGVENDIRWFAMEFIDGAPIDRHVEQQNLDWRKRLALLGQVCEAIGQAHELGLVHRDLKPSNVLIDRDGNPRVIDFGIALDLHGANDPSCFACTTAYASPEQIGGAPVTVHSDIYQLGLLVRELVLESATPASSPPGIVRRNLATVVAKACDAEPRARYASALALADDLSRVMRHRAAHAGGLSGWHRLRLLLQRQRLGAAVFAATALLAVVGLAADWSADRASAARRAEEIQLAQSGRAFLSRALMNVVVSNAAASPLDRLDAAAERTRQMTQTPAVRIAALEALTDAYFDLGMGGPARAQQLVAATVAEFEHDYPTLLEPRARLATLLARCEGATASIDAFRRSLDEAERLHREAGIDPRSLTALRLGRQRMFLLEREEKIDEALALATTLIENTDGALGTTLEFGRILHRRGHIRWNRAEDFGALDDLRHTKQIFDAIYGRGYAITTMLAGVIAEIEVMHGTAFGTVVQDLQENLAATDALYTPETIEAAQARAVLGGFIVKWSDDEDGAASALTYLEPAYETLSRTEKRFLGLTVEQDYAAALMASRKYPEAVRVLAAALAQRMSNGSPESPYVVSTRMMLADAECHAGDARRAMASLDEIAGNIEEDASSQRADYWMLRSRCLLQQKRFAEARQAFEEIARAEPDANTLARRRYRRIEAQIRTALIAAAESPSIDESPVGTKR